MQRNEGTIYNRTGILRRTNNSHLSRGTSITSEQMPSIFQKNSLSSLSKREDLDSDAIFRMSVGLSNGSRPKTNLGNTGNRMKHVKNRKEARDASRLAEG